MTKKIIISLLLILFVQFANAAEESLILNILTKGVKSSLVFAVDKGKREAYLYKIENDIPSIQKKFTGVIVGEFAGDKIKEGDKRTPEGIYYITGFTSGNKLPDMYGAGAFPLNYPNFVDRLNGKTGHGIWIHGRDNGRKDVSSGCVVLNNDDIEYLRKIDYVGMPVILAKSLSYSDKLSYMSEKSFWMNHIDEFLKSWKNNDINAFSKMVHVRFSDTNHKSFSQYIQHKKKLMEAYPKKTIFLDGIKVFKENDSEVVFDFEQFYCAPNLVTEGKKRLSLIKEGDEFKIIAEEFINSKNNILDKIVLGFLQDWKKAWESKNIDEYIKYYSNNFRSGNFDYNGWKEDKGGKFTRLNKIEVGIGDVKITQNSPERYTVTLVQKYSSDSLSDTGLKTLVLEGCPGEFKIVSESWGKLK